MLVATTVTISALLMPLFAQGAGDPAGDPAAWTIYITNDNCPDYTWGLTEEATRRSFADVVRAHLDAMSRTDKEAPESQDRYNMAVTQEALCFLERYPDRKDELLRRIREGRILVSPYLCNSLWGFQSVEGMLRTFYPARRLEKEYGVPIDVAEHIEEPSLPWGVASILAGCGIRWVSNAFLSYDSTFGALRSPPLFAFEGPDGSRVRVVMDPWASNKANYTQGAYLLRETKAILAEWIPHYREMGSAYPVRLVLASGTHGDISPGSGGAVQSFADALRAYNAAPGPHPRLFNATLRQFTDAIDDVQSKSPFLPVVRGCFGHSWDLWPLCTAKYAADMRDGERQLLSAEALLSIASRLRPGLRDETRIDRERAEWCLAMLSDHAWNGTDEANKRQNSGLRRQWSQELGALARKLQEEGWSAMSLAPDPGWVAAFNPLGHARKDLVRLKVPDGGPRRVPADRPWQIVEEEGSRFLYFLSDEVPGFGLWCHPLQGTSSDLESVGPGPGPTLGAGSSAGAWKLESPFYLVSVDAATGGISSLVHKPTGLEMVQRRGLRTFCQTVYFDGREHVLENVTQEVVAAGPVLARLKIQGSTAGIRVVNHVTVYAAADRGVEFDIRIQKPIATVENRLCQAFPLCREGSVLRLETAGAVIRPRPQPDGDLLEGADARRFAVQGFIDGSSPGGPGFTLATLDAFALRLDSKPVAFEAMGNDQNHKEVIGDQDGITEFRIRYAVVAHEGDYDGPLAFRWSRAVATPLLLRGARPALEEGEGLRPSVQVDSTRVIATCLKPTDRSAGPGVLLRIWEVSGRSGPVSIRVKGFHQAFRTDLLERDLQELRIVDGVVTIDVRGHGFAAARLLP